MEHSTLRALPGMNTLLEHPLLISEDRYRVKLAEQDVLNALRADVLSGRSQDVPTADECDRQVLVLFHEQKFPCSVV